MWEVFYAKAARADLRDIALYIAGDNPVRAYSFVDELRDAALKAAERPESFPARGELAPGVRAARHGRYLIFFIYEADKIEVLRVLHGARDLAQAFGQ